MQGDFCILLVLGFYEIDFMTFDEH